MATMHAAVLVEPGRLVVDINVGCGICYYCRRNEILNCVKAQQIGISCDGAFAEYVHAPANLIIPAPSDTAVEVLALTEPLACVVRAARKSRMTFGQSVIVIGAGPIGNLNVQMARLVGAAPIIVAETSPERAEMACEAGTDIAVTNPGLLSETVRKNTAGRGADVVIESVGHPDLYQEAFRLIRPGGHVTTFGITDPGDSVPLDLLQTVLRENSIKGSVAGMGQDMRDALTLLIHNRIVTRYFTDAEYPLTNIQKAFDSLNDRPGNLKTQIAM